jgi:hypothetical protein
MVEVDRCYGLSKENFGKIPGDCLKRYLLVQSGKVLRLERYMWYGVGWKVSHLRKVMLESAKDRFWRVDTLG